MSKRGNGEGSLYERKDGTWCAALKGSDGGRRVLYARTRAEAAAKLHDAHESLKRSRPIPSVRETLAQFIARWLSDVAAPTLTVSTLERYSRDVRLHILPALGSLKLADVTPRRVQTFIGELTAAGLGPRGVAHCRAVLRVALSQAQREGLIGQNAAKLVSVPRQVKKLVAALAPADARTLLAAFKDHELEPLVTVALATGLRQGELLGLAWDDLDLNGGTVRVLRQLQRIRHQYVLVDLKTHSQRTLPLPAVAVAALRTQSARQSANRLLYGPAWKDTRRVFSTSDGDYLNGSAVTHRFQKQLRTTGIDHLSFHDLRHGSASLLLAQGASMRVVMEQLGHSQISLTMNTYAHVVPALMRDAADKLDQVFAPAKV